MQNPLEHLIDNLEPIIPLYGLVHHILDRAEEERESSWQSNTYDLMLFTLHTEYIIAGVSYFT